MSRAGRIPIFLGVICIGAALVITGYNLKDGIRAQNAAEAALTELKPDIISDSDGEDPEPLGYYPGEEMPKIRALGEDYIGILEIPSLGAELPVMADWSYKNLKIAPCRYSGSLYEENLVICAHNYPSHFGGIGSIPLGAEVRFTDAKGNIFLYEVTEVESLGPRAVENMTNGEYELTLFTCTVEGRSRITVRCRALTDIRD